MSPRSGFPSPPAWADTMLRRLLPRGVRGLSIIADLHEEFRDIEASRGRRWAGFWYGREAVLLAMRYGLLRFLAGRDDGLPMNDERGGEVMADVLADMKYGLRMLARTPGLSLVAVLTIALGVGFTTHTYSSVYGTVVRGLPVPEPDRLVYIDQSILEQGITQTDVPPHDFLDLRARQTVFDDVAGFYQGTVNLSGEAGPPERFGGAFMTGNAFDVLGVPPAMGRTFRDGEGVPGAPGRVVLSYHVWQNRFGGDPAILGTSVRANAESMEIVGVMPEGFRFPFQEDIWVLYQEDVSRLARRAGQDLSVFGRLAPGVAIEAARAELAAISASIEEQFPQENHGVVFGVRPYAENYMPPQIAAVMWMMLAATFGVLLIACANVANLLLARASIRSREVAIRTALGASRARVIRQLLSESFMLAVAGGILGVGLAWLGVELFNGAIAGIERPYWIDIRLDGPALTFALLVTLAASLVAGTMPAIRASGAGVGEILKDETRGSSSFRLGRFSTGLVVGEIAVSAALLISAGLMIKSVVNLRSLDLGFDAEGVLTGRIGLFESDYPELEDRQSFFRDLESKLEAEPGVLSAALTTSLPALGAGRAALTVDGVSYTAPLDHPRSNYSVVTGGFFETFGIPVLEGRAFAESEIWETSDLKAVVNESFVRSVLGGAEPIGARIHLGYQDSGQPWIRVVGVVPDVHVGGGVGGIGDDDLDPAFFYLTPGTFDLRFISLALRTAGPPAALASRLREIVLGLDPNLPVYDLLPIDEAVSGATWAFGLFGSLFAIVGVAALFMAAVGLYGVMAFAVSRRRQELGVRMALGAGPERILQLVLRRGLIQLIVGLGIGMALGYGLSRPLAVITFGVELADPAVYGAIMVTLTAAGLLACVVPARAAMRSDPVVAMRPD